ncbi:6418_t:CDS:2, partial [Racocetra persica]
LNQITGIEEDRINKPHRPIPSGLVTIEALKLSNNAFCKNLFSAFGAWIMFIVSNNLII